MFHLGPVRQSQRAQQALLHAGLVLLAVLIVYAEVVDGKSKYKKKKKRDPSKGQRYFRWAVSFLLGMPVCIFLWNVVRDPALPRLFKLAWNKCRGRLSKKLTAEASSAGGRRTSRGVRVGSSAAGGDNSGKTE